MSMPGLMRIATRAVFGGLRLLWRLRLLIVVVVLMMLLMQHMYCRRNTAPPPPCPDCHPEACVPSPCNGSDGSGEDAGLSR